MGFLKLDWFIDTIFSDHVTCYIPFKAHSSSLYYIDLHFMVNRTNRHPENKILTSFLKSANKVRPAVISIAIFCQ